MARNIVDIILSNYFIEVNIMKKEYNSPAVRVVLLQPITLLAGSETIPVSNKPATEWSEAKGGFGSVWIEDETEE